MDLSTWVTQHPKGAVALGAFFLWVSIVLILHMWLVYRRAPFLKKLLWSFILLLPLFGWLFYAGCFYLPEVTDTPCPPNSDATTTG